MLGSKRLFAAVGVAMAVLVAVPPVGADNIQNDVVADVNGDKTVSIASGGSAVVKYRLHATNNDQQNGCNASHGTVTVTINAPAQVTANPGTLLFNACETPQDVTFSSSTLGNYNISVSASGGNGTYNGNPGKFTLVVGAPADSTPPVITPTVTGTSGNNGWYVSDVLVSWSVTDAESDITGSTGCAPTTISSDTLGTTLTCQATSAGGTSTESVTVKRDATAPTATVTGVTGGAVYTLGSQPAAGCSTTDATSGVATPATLTVTGTNANGSGGAITARCAGAVDNAGNAAGAASATYAVRYAFTGFNRPVDSQPTFNVVKAGSAVPIKFHLGGNQGLDIFAAGSPGSAVIACNPLADADPVEETVTPGSSTLSYDAATGEYTYVWKTAKTWTGCRQLTVTFNEGTVRKANFQFK